MSRDSTFSASDSSFTSTNNMFGQNPEDPHYLSAINTLDLAETKPVKQPQMSWFLTIFLLIVVTGVSVS